MRLFLDSGNMEEIRQAAKWGVISGVTTNPSLILAGKGSSTGFRETVQEACFLISNSISAEVTVLDAPGMIEQAQAIARWSPNVTIKIAITPAGLEAIKALSDMDGDAEHFCEACAWQEKCSLYPEVAHDIIVSRGITVNATLAFSANQALLAALAGATYVSPFVGRLDDIGHEGMQVVREAVEIFERYGLETQVIAASIRHPLHVSQAAKAGADIATVPFKVLQQMVNHPLTDAGIKRFLDDWARFQG